MNNIIKLNHINNYKFNINYIKFIHLPKSGGTTLKKIKELYNLEYLLADGFHQPISKLCNPINYKYIIIIRNPISRVISYYNMVKYNKHYPYKEYEESLNLFLNNCWEVNNQLTLYLAGYQNIDNNIPYITEDIYTTAKNNLKNCYKVLDFNNIELDIKTFISDEYNININNIPNERKYNYNKNISNEDLELIREHNKYDILLYEFLLKKFLII